jgi:hypothetical protein
LRYRRRSSVVARYGGCWYKAGATVGFCRRSVGLVIRVQTAKVGCQVKRLIEESGKKSGKVGRGKREWEREKMEGCLSGSNPDEGWELGGGGTKT